ncbi:hypothetical protein COT72_00065 [archaeon CG10_big_fil_rev_8_21_14_0_10_43_11]|nr:MAG: hypothetical protein COT72_00065 [archaeon CG10_big_fil_rev_8_21_14_0_10_43_11]
MSACSFCSLPKKDILFETDTSRVREGDGAHHGHVQVIFKRHETDVLQLSKKEYAAFCDDLRTVAKAVQEVLAPDTLNYALYGNWVAHLHWHIYPRYKTDPDFAQPPILNWKVMGARVRPARVRLEPKPFSKIEKRKLKVTLEK